MQYKSAIEIWRIHSAIEIASTQTKSASADWGIRVVSKNHCNYE